MSPYQPLIDILPLLVLFAFLGVVLWYRIRAGKVANLALRGRIDQQIELGRRHVALVEAQLAELKRIADALERRDKG